MGMTQSTSAHRTGFQGDIQCALIQILGTQGIGGGGDGQHLGVGGHVVEGLGLVVGAGDDLVVAYHHGPDGDFVGLKGQLGLLVGLFHIGFVGENGKCHFYRYL